MNSVDTVNVEFNRLPELDSEVGERNHESMEQLGITMQKNLNKYGRTVGLEFALDVTVEDELVSEFAVQKKWNTRILTVELVLKNRQPAKHCCSSRGTRCCLMVSRQ